MIHVFFLNTVIYTVVYTVPLKKFEHIYSFVVKSDEIFIFYILQSCHHLTLMAALHTTKIINLKTDLMKIDEDKIQ